MGLKEIETTESTGERCKVSLMCFGFMFWIQCNKRFFVIHFTGCNIWLKNILLQLLFTSLFLDFWSNSRTFVYQVQWVYLTVQERDSHSYNYSDSNKMFSKMFSINHTGKSISLQATPFFQHTVTGQKLFPCNLHNLSKKFPINLSDKAFLDMGVFFYGLSNWVSAIARHFPFVYINLTHFTRVKS